MEVSSVDSPDNKGPDFLSVPAPEAVPSLISPDSSCDKSEGPENETNDVELVVGSLKLL